MGFLLIFKLIGICIQFNTEFYLTFCEFP